MKLIDVLNMISKGELKEGTKIKLLYDDTIYELYCDDLIREGDNRPFFDLYSFEVFREEVEIIEPTDNTTEKIEELVADEINGKSLAEALSIIGSKLNEVIRRLNNAKQ